MATTSDKPDIQSLSKELSRLANRMLFVCNADGPPVTVEIRDADIPLSNRVAKAYESYSDLIYYTIFRKTERKAGEAGNFPGEVTVENDLIALGAITYSHCRDATYWCRPVLEKLLSDNPYVLSIRQARGIMHPVAIYVVEDDLGDEPLYSHDFYSITLKDNEKFVFDPAGYQFGYKDFVYTMKDYKKLLESFEFVDMEEEEDEMEKSWDLQKLGLARKDRTEVEQKTREELLAGQFWCQ